MLPTGGYGSSGYNHLSFRDDPRGYRKKGQLTKQLIKLFPILCGLLALALTAAVVLLNTNIKHWKAEHQRVQGMYDRKGEDAQRLQRLLNTERDTSRRQAQDLAKVQGTKSNLEAEVRVASDQRRQLQDAADGHSKRVDELVASLNAAEARYQQLEEASKQQKELDARRLQALQIQSDNHIRLWTDLNHKLKAVTAQHELKESEWNSLKADMEAQMAKDSSDRSEPFGGGVDAAAVLRGQLQPPPPPPPAARASFGGAGQQSPEGQGGSPDPEVARLASLLASLGMGGSDGHLEAVISEFMRVQQGEAAHPGLEQPVQADAARKLADLMRDRGIVTAGSSHDFLTQTLAKYFSQGSTQQMVGRGNARQAPAAPDEQQQQQQPAAGDSAHMAGRKEMPERQGSAEGTTQQPPQQGDAGAVAAGPDASPAPHERWQAFRRSRDAPRVKVDAAGFVA